MVAFGGIPVETIIALGMSVLVVAGTAISAHVGTGSAQPDALAYAFAVGLSGSCSSAAGGRSRR